MATPPSRPGRASSVAVGLSMLLVDPPFLRRLPRGKPGQRTGRDIIRDDGARCNPSVVANLDRRIEDSVHAGPDVAADPRPRLRLAGLVLEVRRDVPGRHVRAVTDLGVADVRQVRDLRAGSDCCVLDLDERADLRSLADHADRSHIGEGADLGATLALGNERAERVGYRELALGVVRVQALERRPELLGLEDVDPGVDLAQCELVARGVAGLDDPREPTVAVTDDPAVGARVSGLEGEDGRRRVARAMRVDERADRLGPECRDVPVEDEDVTVEALERRARAADRVAGSERLLLHDDLDVLEEAARL